MRKTFRLVAGMCPNIRNALRIQSERLECTSNVNECRRNFHSDGIPAHSDTRVTRVLVIVISRIKVKVIELSHMM